ncbi:hypothetical protein, partial [Mesorhizobium tianshanense]|uniref:hypothetical protein n=1 Tax=Mesorhizobium tianshanense TaxID=39844 RepID=UPI0024E0F90E
LASRDISLAHRVDARSVGGSAMSPNVQSPQTVHSENTNKLASALQTPATRWADDAERNELLVNGHVFKFRSLLCWVRSV